MHNCFELKMNTQSIYLYLQFLGYNPHDPASLQCEQNKKDAIVLGVRILAARHLFRKSVRGMVSPYIEIEICGADYDNSKFKTKTISDNGFNPVWDEFFDFNIRNPNLALLRYDI